MTITQDTIIDARSFLQAVMDADNKRQAKKGKGYRWLQGYEVYAMRMLLDAAVPSSGPWVTPRSWQTPDNIAKGKSETARPKFPEEMTIEEVRKQHDDVLMKIAKGEIGVVVIPHWHDETQETTMLVPLAKKDTAPVEPDLENLMKRAGWSLLRCQSRGGKSPAWHFGHERGRKVIIHADDSAKAWAVLHNEVALGHEPEPLAEAMREAGKRDEFLPKDREAALRMIAEKLYVLLRKCDDGSFVEGDEAYCAGFHAGHNQARQAVRDQLLGVIDLIERS
jgi:hypothetical protein